MQAFTDSTGRSWEIALTIDTLKRVKSLLKIDLARPEADAPSGERDEEGRPIPLHVQIVGDVCLLADVVFAAVKPQADAAGVTDEQFGQSLGGDAITAAAEAFLEEWTDFFRSRQRTDLVAMIQKYRTLMERGVKAVETELAALDVEAAVDQAVRQAGAQAREKLAEAASPSTPGNSSGNSPESSASTPVPSPSAS